MGLLSITRGHAQSLAAVLGLIVILTGCQTSKQPIIDEISQSVPGKQAVTLTPTMVVTSLSPSTTPIAPVAITSEIETPTVIVAPAIPTPIPTSNLATNEILTTTPTSEITFQPTETPIPPTFTPPPPPPFPEGEHFWFQRPVPRSGIAWTDKTYPYGSTRGGTLRPHTGVEFQVPLGTPVLAASDGTVRVAGSDNMIAYGPHVDFYGNLVIIEANSSNNKPVYHLYGHLSEVNVVEGQTVASGEQIGLSGESGVADGPHLHFEVRVGENSYIATRNPLLWLFPFPQTGIVIGRVLWPNGEVAMEVPVTLIRVDAPSPYTATTTYASGEPNPDDAFDENFAIDDVVPGYYQVIVGAGENRQITEMWVFPGQTNFLEVVLDN